MLLLVAALPLSALSLYPSVYVCSAAFSAGGNLIIDPNCSVAQTLGPFEPPTGLSFASSTVPSLFVFPSAAQLELESMNGTSVLYGARREAPAVAPNPPFTTKAVAFPASSSSIRYIVLSGAGNLSALSNSNILAASSKGSTVSFAFRCSHCSGLVATIIRTDLPGTATTPSQVMSWILGNATSSTAGLVWGLYVDSGTTSLAWVIDRSITSFDFRDLKYSVVAQEQGGTDHSIGDIFDGLWHHVALTVQESPWSSQKAILQLFIDGYTAPDSFEFRRCVNKRDVEFDSSGLVGAQWTAGFGAGGFELYNLQIHESALSQRQIAALGSVSMRNELSVTSSGALLCAAFAAACACLIFCTSVATSVLEVRGTNWKTLLVTVADRNSVAPASGPPTGDSEEVDGARVMTDAVAATRLAGNVGNVASTTADVAKTVRNIAAAAERVSNTGNTISALSGMISPLRQMLQVMPQVFSVFQTMALYFRMWTWPKEFASIVRNAVFVFAIDLTAVHIPAFITPLLQLLCVIVLSYVVYTLRVKDRTVFLESILRFEASVAASLDLLAEQLDIELCPFVERTSLLTYTEVRKIALDVLRHNRSTSSLRVALVRASIELKLLRLADVDDAVQACSKRIALSNPPTESLEALLSLFVLKTGQKIKIEIDEMPTLASTLLTTSNVSPCKVFETVLESALPDEHRRLFIGMLADLGTWIERRKAEVQNEFSSKGYDRRSTSAVLEQRLFSFRLDLADETPISQSAVVETASFKAPKPPANGRAPAARHFVQLHKLTEDLAGLTEPQLSSAAVVLDEHDERSRLIADPQAAVLQVVSVVQDNESQNGFENHHTLFLKAANEVCQYPSLRRMLRDVYVTEVPTTTSGAKMKMVTCPPPAVSEVRRLEDCVLYRTFHASHVILGVGQKGCRAPTIPAVFAKIAEQQAPFVPGSSKSTCEAAASSSTTADDVKSHRDLYLVRVGCVEDSVCPEHGRRLIEATEEGHFRVRMMNGVSPYQCCHKGATLYKTQQKEDSSKTKQKNDASTISVVEPCATDQLLVCPEDTCCYTLCSQCFNHSSGRRGRRAFFEAAAEKATYMLQHGTLFDLLLFLALQSIMFPVTQNSLMIIACHPSFQCDFPTCYHNPSASFVVAVVLAVLLLGVFRFGVAGVWFRELWNRKELIAPIVGDSGFMWEWFLAADTTVMSSMYRRYEFAFMTTEPILQLVVQLSLSAVSALTPVDSLAQLASVIAVQGAYGAYFGLSNPYIDPWMDLLTNVGIVQQLLQLCWMSVFRMMLLDDPNTTTMNGVMLATAGGYVGFVFVATYYTVIAPWRRSRRLLDLNVFARQLDRYESTSDSKIQAAGLRKVLDDHISYYGEHHYCTVAAMARMVSRTTQAIVDKDAIAAEIDSVRRAFLECCEKLLRSVATRNDPVHLNGRLMVKKDRVALRECLFRRKVEGDDLGDRITEALVKIIQLSRDVPNFATGAANAMTLLAAVHIVGPSGNMYLPIEGFDFSGVAVNRCDVRGATFRNVTFARADISQSRMERTTFIGCNFTGTLSTGTKWGAVVQKQLRTVFEAKLSNTEETVRALCMLSDGITIAAATDLCFLRLYDHVQQVGTEVVHTTSPIVSMMPFPIGLNRIIALHENGDLRLFCTIESDGNQWNLCRIASGVKSSAPQGFSVNFDATQMCVFTENAVFGMHRKSQSPDDMFAGEGKTVDIQRTWSFSLRVVSTASFTPDSQLLLLACTPCVISIVNPESGVVLTEIATPSDATILRYSCGGSLLAVGWLGVLFVWDVTGAEVAHYRENAFSDLALKHFDWSPSIEAVYVFGIETEALYTSRAIAEAGRAKLVADTRVSGCVAVTNDGKALLQFHPAGMIRSYELDAVKLSVRTDPDGMQSPLQQIPLLNLPEDMAFLDRNSAPRLWILSAAVAGHHIITVSANEVCVWDSTTMRMLWHERAPLTSSIDAVVVPGEGLEQLAVMLTVEAKSILCWHDITNPLRVHIPPTVVSNAPRDARTCVFGDAMAGSVAALSRSEGVVLIPVRGASSRGEGLKTPDEDPQSSSITIYKPSEPSETAISIYILHAQSGESPENHPRRRIALLGTESSVVFVSFDDSEDSAVVLSFLSIPTGGPVRDLSMSSFGAFLVVDAEGGCSVYRLNTSSPDSREGPTMDLILQTVTTPPASAPWELLGGFEDYSPIATHFEMCGGRVPDALWLIYTRDNRFGSEPPLVFAVSDLTTPLAAVIAPRTCGGQPVGGFLLGGGLDAAVMTHALLFVSRYAADPTSKRRSSNIGSVTTFFTATATTKDRPIYMLSRDCSKVGRITKTGVTCLTRRGHSGGGSQSCGGECEVLDWMFPFGCASSIRLVASCSDYAVILAISSDSSLHLVLVNTDTLEVAGCRAVNMPTPQDLIVASVAQSEPRPRDEDCFQLSASSGNGELVVFLATRNETSSSSSASPTQVLSGFSTRTGEGEFQLDLCVSREISSIALNFRGDALLLRFDQNSACSVVAMRDRSSDVPLKLQTHLSLTSAELCPAVDSPYIVGISFGSSLAVLDFTTGEEIASLPLPTTSSNVSSFALLPAAEGKSSPKLPTLIGLVFESGAVSVAYYDKETLWWTRHVPPYLENPIVATRLSDRLWHSADSEGSDDSNAGVFAVLRQSGELEEYACTSSERDTWDAASTKAFVGCVPLQFARRTLYSRL